MYSNRSYLSPMIITISAQGFDGVLIKGFKVQTDRSAFSKKGNDEFEQALLGLEAARKKKKVDEALENIISPGLRLFANRNIKKLRNRPQGENRAIGAYPHFNIEDSASTDDGEEIPDTVNSQLNEFGDSEYSDEEDLRVARGYTQLGSHIGKEISNTSDQVDFRKVDKGMIK